jgi:hypothetical protein
VTVRCWRPVADVRRGDLNKSAFRGRADAGEEKSEFYPDPKLGHRCIARPVLHRDVPLPKYGHRQPS